MRKDTIKQISYERSSQARRMTTPPKLFDRRQDNVNDRRMACAVD
ncbi:MAG: hypothetical protein ABJA66_14510 [Actinomycetota bacterium]